MFEIYSLGSKCKKIRTVRKNMFKISLVLTAKDGLI